MASTSYEKDRVRVTISSKEISNWAGKDTPQALVQHFIRLGRERYESLSDQQTAIESIEESTLKLEKKLDKLQDSVDCLSHLVLQTSHLLATISAVPQYELELSKAKVREGKGDQNDKNRVVLEDIKHKVFKNYVDSVFPNSKTDTFTSTTTK